MHRTLSLTLVATMALAGVSCGDSRGEPPTAPALAPESHGPSHHAGPISNAVWRDIARLAAATARFHRFSEAERAGYGTRITDCFSNPELGGMGYHYGNPDLIDGTVEALKPELLLYEPQKNGTLRFVAVEYVVPFTAWTAAEPPRLYGQSFHRNETFGLWVLHVWHFKHNPSGIFSDWNPRVSCQYATP